MTATTHADVSVTLGGARAVADVPARMFGSFVEHPFDKGVWKQALAVIRNIRIEHPV